MINDDNARVSNEEIFTKYSPNAALLAYPIKDDELAMFPC
jgi:hypothetical protein